MAGELNLVVRSEKVGASSFAGKQFYAANRTAGLAVLATAGKNIIGVLQDAEGVGHACTVGVSGITKVAISASQTITEGDLLEVDSGGTFIPKASGTAVARAREALVSVAAVKIIEAELLKSNAAYV